MNAVKPDQPLMRFVILILFWNSLAFSQESKAPLIIFDKKNSFAAKRLENGEIELKRRDSYSCLYCADEHTRWDSTGEIIEFALYDQYGSIGNLQVITEQRADGRKTLATYSPDTTGKLVQVDFGLFYPARLVDSGWVYVDSMFSPDGTIQWWSSRYVSTDSLKASLSMWGPDGAMIHYSEGGHWLEESTEKEITETVFDENTGTRTETLQRYSEDGTLQWLSKKTYNGSGDLIYEYRQFNGMESEEYHFQYSYDEYENWTRKFIFNQAKELIYVVEREILYCEKKESPRK